MAVETTDLEKAVRYGQVVESAKLSRNFEQACVAQTGLIEVLKKTDMIDALAIAKKEQVLLCRVFNKRS
jgi:hypothetical protein